MCFVLRHNKLLKQKAKSLVCQKLLWCETTAVVRALVSFREPPLRGENDKIHAIKALSFTSVQNNIPTEIQTSVSHHLCCWNTHSDFMDGCCPSNTCTLTLETYTSWNAKCETEHWNSWGQTLFTTKANSAPAFVYRTKMLFGRSANYVFCCMPFPSQGKKLNSMYRLCLFSDIQEIIKRMVWCGVVWCGACRMASKKDCSCL